jgi:hypothetical protein
MARFGLIGPSYRSQSLTADCQTTMGWYLETIESQYGKAAMALYPTPGQSLFATLPDGGPLRGELEINGRAFAVSNRNFCEVFPNGTFTVIAQIANDDLPVSMVASPQQILIASAGSLYVYQIQSTPNSANILAGAFYQVPSGTFTAPGGASLPLQVEYIDGFFLVLLKNSQTIYISTPLDATSWPGLQQITVSVFSDNVQGMIQNQRQLYVYGRKRSTTYYDSGSANIFDVNPSGTVENGMVSNFGMCRLDNSVFWLDQDERGSGIVRRYSGFTPTRVSNHAIEFAMQGYATISDCVVYPYQDQGHSFAVFYFPTANKTWVYDAATGQWHERGYWNEVAGMFSAHKSWNHMLAFGKHLVGDPTSGNIYQMAIPSVAVGGGYNFVTDSGNPIVRQRRSPHISVENKWMFHNELVLDVETGLGPMPPLLDGSGNPRGPKVMLRWSNDYAHTWSNQYFLDAGQAGQFRQRVRRTKLGRARDRVYEIECSDPIPWRIISAYLDADGPAPYKAQQRLSATYGKVE